MKQLLAVILCLPLLAYGQFGTWTWMHGDTIGGAVMYGIYGTKGIPDSKNTPGARYEASEWYRPQDNTFWLYGGGGCDGDTSVINCNMSVHNSDLWKFDPSTNQWTWMKGDSLFNMEIPVYGPIGIFDDSITPGVRGFTSITWTDTSGDFWLFGGQSGWGLKKADLFRYSVVLNQWAFMGGSVVNNTPGRYGIKGVANPANYPAARTESAAGWTDNNNNLWLFGGDNHNDMWKFEIASGLWTWMSGDSTVSSVGRYGIKGVLDANNVPGGRQVWAHWKDNNDDLWLWGGSSPPIGENNNDLWRYNIASNQWVWESGDTIANPSPSGCSYKKGVYSDCNKPKGRWETRTSWIDQDGDFWLFGGGNLPQFNDLWMYDVSRTQWVWVGGGRGGLSIAPHIFGVKGIADSLNQPAPTSGGNPWVDSSGDFWMFGGFWNTLWRYELPDKSLFQDAPLPIVNFTADTTRGCMPHTVDFINLSDSVYNVCNNVMNFLWDFGDGDTSTARNPTHIYTSPGIYSVKLITQTKCNGSDSITLLNYIVVDSFPVADLQPDSLFACVPFTINPGNNNPIINYNYNWSFGDGGSDTLANPTYSYLIAGVYPLELVVSNTCGSDSDQIIVTVHSNPTVNLGNDTNCLSGNYLLDVGTFSTYVWSTGDTTPQILVNTTGNYYITVSDTNVCTDMDTVILIFSTKPNIVLADSATVCDGVSIQLQASGGNTYIWSPNTAMDSINIPNPMVSPASDIIYSVFVFDTCGLSDTDAIVVSVISCELYIPNAFSPNGDGENDLFMLRSLGINDIVLTIYDRWGNKVFETTDSNQTWDGKNSKGLDMSIGVYVYYLTANLIDVGKEIVRKGNITLVR